MLCSPICAVFPTEIASAQVKLLSLVCKGGKCGIVIIYLMILEKESDAETSTSHVPHHENNHHPDRSLAQTDKKRETKTGEACWSEVSPKNASLLQSTLVGGLYQTGVDTNSTRDSSRARWALANSAPKWLSGRLNLGGPGHIGRHGPKKRQGIAEGLGLGRNDSPISSWKVLKSASARGAGINVMSRLPD